MDLRDLNKINLEDLKAIDWELAKAHLLAKPDIAINALMVMIMMAVFVSSFNSYATESKSLKSQISELETKYEAREAFEATQKGYAEFLKNFPETVPDNRLIEILSEIAIKRNIQIIAFSPSEAKSNELVRLTKVRINIRSDNYPDIIRFMNDIEDSEYSIRIGEWVGISTDPDAPKL